MTLRPTREARRALNAFVDSVYLHQVVVRRSDGSRVIYRDLDDALAIERDDLDSNLEPPSILAPAAASSPEWRIHFHIPLHSEPTPLFDNTADTSLGCWTYYKQRLACARTSKWKLIRGKYCHPNCEIAM